jgi:hypothetical protein
MLKPWMWLLGAWADLKKQTHGRRKRYVGEEDFPEISFSGGNNLRTAAYLGPGKLPSAAMDEMHFDTG